MFTVKTQTSVVGSQCLSRLRKRGSLPFTSEGKQCTVCEEPTAEHVSLEGDKGTTHVGEEVSSQKWEHQWDQSSVGPSECSPFEDMFLTLSFIMNNPQLFVTR